METTKEKLIRLLEESNGEYLSGNMIAESLGITRTAVWKNIKQLEAEDYLIDAVTNKGYRLDPLSDTVNARNIAEYLQDDKKVFTTEVLNTVSSTNTYLKEKAETLPDWYVAIAGSQSAGRGRTGRSFYSPKGTGVYLSALLRPEIPVSDAGRLTTAAAVAASRAIEECTDAEPKIKWVNDVYVDGKKVCGILTEASVNFETGEPDWIVTGIGFNVYLPEGGFPEEIAEVAGAISDHREKNLRARLAASFIRHFYDLCGDLQDDGLLNEYTERCFIIGQKIDIIRGSGQVPALALGITEDFGLRIQYNDGREEVLSAGEVRIRPHSKLK